MIKKLQKLAMAAGILSLVFIIPMIIPVIAGNNKTQKEILKKYCAIPFWSCISVFIICTAVCLLYLSVKEGKGDWKLGIAFPAVSIILAAIGVFAFYSEIINSLRDFPYLNHPAAVSLKEARFSYNNIGDSPTIQVSGKDSEGNEESFSISRREYEKGQSLYQQTKGTSGHQMVVADVEYLPYSDTVLNLNMRIEENTQN